MTHVVGQNCCLFRNTIRFATTFQHPRRHGRLSGFIELQLQLFIAQVDQELLQRIRSEALKTTDV